MRQWILRAVLPVLMASVMWTGAAALEGRSLRVRVPNPDTPTATIKDLMLGIVDPAADTVWNSVMTVLSETGLSKRPLRMTKTGSRSATGR